MRYLIVLPDHRPTVELARDVLDALLREVEESPPTVRCPGAAEALALRCREEG